MLVRKVSKDLASVQARRNWFIYWQYFSRTHRTFCAEINCLAQSSQAVLVKLDKNKDEIFVIPLCQCHIDNLEGVLEIGDDIEVIPYHYTL